MWAHSSGTYEAEIGSMKGVFNMQVNKGQLLSVDNSNYEALIGTYPHLEGVQMNDNAAKPQLPVDVVLGGGEYARIKTDSRPQIGKEGEPVAELTKNYMTTITCCWHKLARTTTSNSELELADSDEHDQESVYSERTIQTYHLWMNASILAHHYRIDYGTFSSANVPFL